VVVGHPFFKGFQNMWFLTSCKFRICLFNPDDGSSTSHTTAANRFFGRQLHFQLHMLRFHYQLHYTSSAAACWRFCYFDKSRNAYHAADFSWS
jgi:hypothetical protein